MNRNVGVGTLVLAVLFATFLGGCTIVQSPAVGGIYTEVLHGDAVGDGAAGTSKTGEACATSFLGLVATGDASIDTARKNGGIGKIAYVDHKSYHILIFYGQYCTIVRGE